MNSAFTPTSGSQTHKACYSPTTAQTSHPLGAGSSCHSMALGVNFRGEGPIQKAWEGRC